MSSWLFQPWVGFSLSRHCCLWYTYRRLRAGSLQDWPWCFCTQLNWQQFSAMCSARLTAVRIWIRSSTLAAEALACYCVECIVTCRCSLHSEFIRVQVLSLTLYPKSPEPIWQGPVREVFWPELGGIARGLFLGKWAAVGCAPPQRARAHSGFGSCFLLVSGIIGSSPRQGAAALQVWGASAASTLDVLLCFGLA